MLWIETSIAPPKKILLDEARKVGADVLHLPALEVIDLHTDFSLKGYDAVFIASPRAAIIAIDRIKNCDQDIYAIGKGTAKTIEESGCTVKQFGDGSGAENFISTLLQNGIKLQNVAWVSAEETAANLPTLARRFKIKIQHIAVYKTISSKFSKEQVSKIKHPCKWILRSGKGVYAVQQFFQETDSFNPIGKSAETALKALNFAPKI